MSDSPVSGIPVTVVLTVHNPGPYLDVSLPSILTQTHELLEILVVDDGSTEPWRDHPGLVDPRVRIVSQPSNLGVARARNRGVREAQHELVAFLDQDDSWEPTKIERQVEAIAEGSTVAVCSTGFYWHLFDGRTIEKTGYPENYQELLDRGMVNFCSIMTRRDLYLDVGGCDPTLTWAQDHDLVLKLLAAGEHISVPEPLTHYFMHESNRSKNYRGSVSFRRVVLRKHELRARFSGERADADAAVRGYQRAWELYAAQAFDTAREAHKSGRRIETARELLHHVKGRVRRPLSSLMH